MAGLRCGDGGRQLAVLSGQKQPPNPVLLAVGCPGDPAHEKMPPFESQNTRKYAMEAERTNTIRNSLADLTARVAELRRYL